MKNLSIIVPTYNMEKYLHKCLSSLIVSLSQMEKLEVLVVNDGSKDSSSQIAHEFESRYPQTFRVIDKENGNYGSCINRGLKEATGKYIRILDADDFFNTANFECYLSVIAGLDVDMILNNVLLVDCDYKGRREWNLPCERNYIKEWDSTCRKLFPQMHEVTYKRENLLKIGYHQTEGISYTDQQWVFAPISTVKTFFYIPIQVYHYLVGRDGQTMAKDIRKQSLRQQIKVLWDMIVLYEEGKYNQDAKEWMLNKLKENTYSIYKDTIVDGNDDRNELLIDFDKDLKDKFPTYYHQSQEVLVFSKKFACNYGRYWRKHYHLNRWNPTLYIYYSLKSLIP